MKSLIAATAAVSVLLLAGCAKNPDWFGNQPEPEPSCDVAPHATVPRLPVEKIIRPPATPPGWGWVVLRLEVRTLGLGTNGTLENDYCSPVHVTIKGAATEFDLTMLNSAGVPTPERGFSTLTPWADYFTIQYDPSDERFHGKPPQYEIHVTADYLSQADQRRPTDTAGMDSTAPLAVGCAIYNGDEPNAIARDVQSLPATAQCDLYADHFNYV